MTLQFLSPALEPRSSEMLRLNRERWRGLSYRLKTPQQAMGRACVACGATHGVMERCNFACTSCYLSEIANATPPLPFTDVKRQLDSLRAFLGLGGKAQITSGEVTLLRKQDLGRIIAYAHKIGLDPMVMSNGERFLSEPGYLETLVRSYGLRKISIHIDTTQRGRGGLRKKEREEELHPIRDRFATLIREVRAHSGKRLHAAHTVTVTNENFEQVPVIMHWVLDNVDAFRMISFQPTAEVGRTLNRRIEGLTMNAVWAKVCVGVGRSLNRHALHFGHPECSIVSPVLVVSLDSHHEIIECVRENNRWDLRMMRMILEKFGGFRLSESRSFRNLVGIVSMLLRNASFLFELVFYGLYRVWGLHHWLSVAMAHVLRFRKVRVRPMVIVVHKFMSADELDTPLGRERLQACAFKVSVDGRMVSMCEVNATGLRRNLNNAARLQAVRG